MTLGFVKNLHGEPEARWGFIYCPADHRDYFFHHTDLNGCVMEDLDINTTVEFEPTALARGPRAENVRLIDAGSV